MPQSKRLEDDPRYKLLSPENKRIIWREVYKKEPPGEVPSVKPPEEKSLAERVRDYTFDIPIIRAPIEPLNEKVGPIQEDEDINLRIPFNTRTAAELLPDVGASAGGFFGSAGGPVGAAGGILAGQLGGTVLKRGLQQNYPQLFGEQENLSKEMLNQGIGSALNLLPVAGPAVRDIARNTFLKLFPDTLDPIVRKAIKIDPSWPSTVGQMQGGKSLDVIENVLTGGAKEKIIQKQREKTVGDLTRTAESFSPSTATVMERGEEAGRLARDFVATRKIDEEATRAAVEAAGAPNKVYYSWNPDTKKWVESATKPNTLIQKAVDSPIQITQASKYADNALKYLDDLTARFKDTPLVTTGELDSIKSYLRGFKGTGKDAKLNKEPFAVIEEARDNLDKIIQRTPPLERKSTILEELRDSLDKDIENSVKRWGKGSLDKYRALKASKAERRELFAPNVYKRYREASQYPSNFFDDAFKSNENARRFAALTQAKNEGTDNPMAREYVTQILERYSGTEHFKGKDAYQQFLKDEAEGIPQHFMNSRSRQDLKYILARASTSKEAQQMGALGRYAFHIGAGGTAFFGMGPAGLLAPVPAWALAKLTLTNTKAARKFAELQMLPAGSSQVKPTLKALVAAAPFMKEFLPYKD